MAYMICWKHDTVSAWGCPECRSERLSRVVDEAVEEVSAKAKAAMIQRRLETNVRKQS
jgi:hypothetical protein